MSLRALLQQHEQWVKYGLLVTNIIGMLLAIQAYIGFSNINTSIEIVHEHILETQHHIAYTQQFLFPYLESSYAMYFGAHENNKIFENEFMILFEEKDQTTIIQPVQDDSIPERITPPQAWQQLWEDTLRQYQ